MTASFPSLGSADLAPVFDAIRSRLERSGEARRGRMRLPEGVSKRAISLLEALVDSQVRRSVDLEVLERKLVDLGVACDLPSALAALGHPVSEEPARRRAARRQSLDARGAARAEVESWDLDWGRQWLDSIVATGIFSGLDSSEAVGLVSATRDILARIDSSDDPDGPDCADRGDRGDRPSRVDLAAGLLGDSYALDWGTRHSQAVTRALWIRFGGEGREASERAGVNLDHVSAPALTLGLTSAASGGLARLMDEANDLAVPIHLSLLALRRHPVKVESGCDVLVTENPRMVEAACDRRTSYPVIALNGNPSSAALLLVDQLLRSGAKLRYHGDFDASGLQICARMHRLGLAPWRMDSESYLAAVAEAESNGASLPSDRRRSPPTPWSKKLQDVFDMHRLIVHEERLIKSLLI